MWRKNRLKIIIDFINQTNKPNKSSLKMKLLAIIKSNLIHFGVNTLNGSSATNFPFGCWQQIGSNNMSICYQLNSSKRTSIKPSSLKQTNKSKKRINNRKVRFNLDESRNRSVNKSIVLNTSSISSQKKKIIVNKSEYEKNKQNSRKSSATILIVRKYTIEK